MTVFAVIAVLELGLGYLLHRSSLYVWGPDQTISALVFGIAAGCEGCGAVTGVTALVVWYFS